MQVILFSTSTCPVCPKAQSVARETMPDYYEHGLSYSKYKANKGEGKALASKYYVMGVPTFLFVDDDGNEIKRLVGAVSEEVLRKNIEKLLGLRKSFIEKLLGR